MRVKRKIGGQRLSEIEIRVKKKQREIERGSTQPTKRSDIRVLLGNAYLWLHFQLECVLYLGWHNKQHHIVYLIISVNFSPLCFVYITIEHSTRFVTPKWSQCMLSVWIIIDMRCSLHCSTCYAEQRRERGIEFVYWIEMNFDCYLHYQLPTELYNMKKELSPCWSHAA